MASKSIITSEGTSGKAALVGGAVLSGILLAAAFPYPDVGLAAWVALVPLILVLRTATTSEALVLGYLCGFAFFGILFGWCAVFGYAAWAALTLIQAVFFAVFAAVAAPMCRRGGWTAVFGVPAAWVAVEWLRALGPLGVSWGTLSVSQHRNLPLLQAAALGGPYLLSFLVVMGNSAAAEAISRRRSQSLLPSIAAAVVIVTAAVGGAARLRTTWTRLGGEEVTVGLAQAGINKEQGGYFSDPEKLMRAYERLTLRLAYYHAGVVVWPETTVPGLALRDTWLKHRLSRLAKKTGAALVLGSFDPADIRAWRAGVGRLQNCVVAFDRHGRAVGRYAKVHLVPFGEYVPVPANRFRGFLRRWGVPEEDLVPGKRREPMVVGGISIGALVCFESALCEASRELVKKGAQILVFVTNDAWFGRTAAPYQHLAFSPLRAVETGRYVLRAATTGITACFDPYGRVVAAGPLGGEVGIPVRAEIRNGKTPYVVLGDWIVWLSFVLVGAAFLEARMRGAADA
ncbi:MAG: apolipoprotein N-acyltransferase [Armatimonadota bacterium]